MAAPNEKVTQAKEVCAKIIPQLPAGVKGTSETLSSSPLRNRSLRTLATFPGFCYGFRERLDDFQPGCHLRRLPHVQGSGKFKPRVD